jgi:hypothetical protein
VNDSLRIIQSKMEHLTGMQLQSVTPILSGFLGKKYNRKYSFVLSMCPYLKVLHNFGMLIEDMTKNTVMLFRNYSVSMKPCRFL